MTPADTPKASPEAIEAALLREELAKAIRERDAHAKRLEWIGHYKPLISRRQARAWYVLGFGRKAGTGTEFLTALDRAIGGRSEGRG